MEEVGKPADVTSVARQNFESLLNSNEPEVKEVARWILFREAPSPITFGYYYTCLTERANPSFQDQKALLAAADKLNWQEVHNLFKNGACGHNRTWVSTWVSVRGDPGGNQEGSSSRKDC